MLARRFVGASFLFRSSHVLVSRASQARLLYVGRSEQLPYFPMAFVKKIFHGKKKESGKSESLSSIFITTPVAIVLAMGIRIII